MNLYHKILCEVAERWLRKVKKQNLIYHTYPITGSNIACYNGVKWIEIPDAIGFNAYSSCVIECKMSRSDFFDLTKNGYINEKCYLFSICSRIKKGI